MCNQFFLQLIYIGVTMDLYYIPGVVQYLNILDVEDVRYNLLVLNLLAYKLDGLDIFYSRQGQINILERRDVRCIFFYKKHD